MDNEKRPQSQKYLDSEATVKELVAKMPALERKEWDSYGHLKVEPAFQDRVFIVYQPTGKGEGGLERAPNVVAKIRALSFIARDETGCTVRLENESTGQVQEVDHIPKKLFGFPIFVAVPPIFTLRWDARERGGQVKRTLSYILFVKTRNKSEFSSKDNFYVETPNKLRALYPHLDLKLDL